MYKSKIPEEAPTAELWKYGISGDLPILLVKVKDSSDIYVVKDALKAYEYFRVKNINIDLVILDEEKKTYENYVYEKKAANQVMQDAKSDKQANRFGFKYSNLVIEPVELYTVPIVKRSIDKSWSKKIRHGLPFEQAVNGCALEQVRLFGSFIKPNKEISKHSFHFNMIRG